jgi:hypothetical protein
MVSVLASSAVDRRFEPRSNQTKDNKNLICCFSTINELEQRLIDSESGYIIIKVSAWSNMSTRGLLNSE